MALSPLAQAVQDAHAELLSGAPITIVEEIASEYGVPLAKVNHALSAGYGDPATIHCRAKAAAAEQERWRNQREQRERDTAKAMAEIAVGLCEIVLGRPCNSPDRNWHIGVNMKRDIDAILTPWSPGQDNWFNTETGERIFAQSFSHIISRLRGMGWRRISWIRESDFESAGYRCISADFRRQSEPSPWAEDRGYRTVRLARGNTIIAMKGKTHG